MGTAVLGGLVRGTGRWSGGSLLLEGMTVGTSTRVLYIDEAEVAISRNGFCVKRFTTKTM